MESSERVENLVTRREGRGTLRSSILRAKVESKGRSSGGSNKDLGPEPSKRTVRLPSHMDVTRMGV
jgi:hypothetical protein